MDFSGWQRLSLVDYDDNITTTLFMAGCDFRCPFCQNSDLVLHPEKAPRIPWETIRDYLSKRKGVLDAVCITGGEPTMMDDLLEKMKEIKEMGYKIKLDSNGSRPDVLQEAAFYGFVDYFAMDIKNCKEKYGLTAGVPHLNIAPIEKSVDFIMHSGVAYEFRTTIIQEFHTEEDMKKIGEWIQGAERYALQLYIDSERCIEHGHHAVPKEEAERFLEIVKPYVKKAKLRSYD